MGESYNVLRKIERDLINKVRRGEMDVLDAKKERVRLRTERDEWLKDKTIETEVQWRGHSPYPNDTPAEEE